MTGLYMLDYGAGNVRSLVNAINYLGYDIKYVKEPSDIALAEVKKKKKKKTKN
jgi:glutamine amidotransferase/cyclase